nr:defensin-like protein 182 [Quercus suber]
MSNRSTALLFLLVLLVFNSGTMLLTKCDDDICTDGWGPCSADEECDSACKAKHPGGYANCATVGTGARLCYCYYNCGGPPKNICIDGMGYCADNCKDRCAAKHPGGEGVCDSYSSIFCQCLYRC